MKIDKSQMSTGKVQVGDVFFHFDYGPYVRVHESNKRNAVDLSQSCLVYFGFEDDGANYRIVNATLVIE